jgi:DNA helicase-2/ATP-dependent DNA helicase PcrA
VGETVVHAKFGEGVVVKSLVTEDDQEVEVAFPGRGIKKLSVSFAPLERKK